MDMEARRPVVTGILTRERMLELTRGHDGDRLLQKGNLRNLLKKWYPAVFEPLPSGYRESMLRLFGHKLQEKREEEKGSAVPFLIIGLLIGFIVGRS